MSLITQLNDVMARRGYTQTHVARADAQSDLLAAQAPFASDRDSIRELSLAIAMVMAAGIRRNNIRSALRVSHELAHGEENKA